MAFLPDRLREIAIVEGKELGPVVCDNFILVPLKGSFEAGQTMRIVFTAGKVRGVRTSAAAAPVVSAPAG